MMSASLYIAALCSHDFGFCLKVNGAWPFVDPTTFEPADAAGKNLNSPQKPEG